MIWRETWRECRCKTDSTVGWMLACLVSGEWIWSAWGGSLHLRYCPPLHAFACYLSLTQSNVATENRFVFTRFDIHWNGIIAAFLFLRNICIFRVVSMSNMGCCLLFGCDECLLRGGFGTHLRRYRLRRRRCLWRYTTRRLRWSIHKLNLLFCHINPFYFSIVISNSHD